MKYTYLIGNGFDLNIGLRTSFKDVIQEYCKNIENNTELIKRFKKEIYNNISLWSDFEYQMGKFTQQVVPMGEFNMLDYTHCIEDFRDMLVKHLLNEEKRINRYVFINQCDTVCHRSIEYPFQFMRKGAKDRLENYLSNYKHESIEYNFIVFNYTHTFDDFLTPLGYNIIGDYDETPRHWTQEDDDDSMILDRIENVIHVHGELGEAVLLGVNDVTQVVNQEFALTDEFSFNYIKPITNEILEEKQDEISKRIIEESDVIFIYGMSIGQSDKKWWTLIMEWLGSETNNREHFLIVFWYDDTLRRSSPIDNIKNQESIKNKLLTYLPNDLEAKKDDILKHIYCSLNSDIFKLNFNPFTED